MAFLPDTNVWISLLKNPGGKLDAKVRSQPVPDILPCGVVLGGNLSSVCCHPLGVLVSELQDGCFHKIGSIHSCTPTR